MGSTVDGCNSGKTLLCPETVCNVGGIPDPVTDGLPAVWSNIDPDCLSLFYKSIDVIHMIRPMSLSLNHDVLP
jgi:hypothetical protein